MKAQAADLTKDLRERDLIAPDVVYQTPSQIGGQIGGLESVAGAGLWSERLQRITMTMVERGLASAAGAGLWSERLQRITMTMSERGLLSQGQTSAAQRQFMQQTQQQFQQMTPQQQQQMLQQQLLQHAAAHGQQQQMQPQWRTGTFSQEDCQVLKQPEADALALHFREVLGIPVEREANPSKDRPVRRTLPMVRADLESKWPVGLTSVAVQVRLR